MSQIYETAGEHYSIQRSVALSVFAALGVAAAIIADLSSKGSDATLLLLQIHINQLLGQSIPVAVLAGGLMIMGVATVFVEEIRSSRSAFMAGFFVLSAVVNILPYTSDFERAPGTENGILEPLPAPEGAGIDGVAYHAGLVALGSFGGSALVKPALGGETDLARSGGIELAQTASKLGVTIRVTVPNANPRVLPAAEGRLHNALSKQTWSLGKSRSWAASGSGAVLTYRTALPVGAGQGVVADLKVRIEVPGFEITEARKTVQAGTRSVTIDVPMKRSNVPLFIQRSTKAFDY